MIFSLSMSTIIWVGGIILGTFIFYVYIRRLKSKGKLVSNRRWVENIPSIISTLGVLGTFYGITTGLIYFNSDDLDTSIPELLDGLKTAFFTSIAGMVGSLLLSRVTNSYFDKTDGGISDANHAASQICQAVQQMSQSNMNTLNALREQAENQAKDQTAFYRTVGDILTSLQTSYGNTENAINSMVILARSQEVALNDLRNKAESATLSLGTVEENSTSQTAALTNIQLQTKELSNINHNINEMLDVLSGMSSAQEEISEEVKTFGGKLHSEVVEIEDKMDATNHLLVAKFNEFSELLKKSNTEALVEVMKTVTEEFQKQMNALINKLIQENFDQLNQSVEKLNTWQQENKNMISSLTKQYKEMANNFESTSTTLTKVSDDTKALVSEGGKLKQLIDSLNQVIIEDQKFIDVSNKLQETATLSKNNMEQFDESTKVLNDWVRKQRNFVDGVQLLIEKLDELNKIRDYGEQFWKGTKEKMEEGVSIITKGSQTLNTQLTSLDRQFYNRLGATLAELDNCITKMVEHVNNRR